MKLNEITRIAEYEPNVAILQRAITDPSRTRVDTCENVPIFKTVIGYNVVYDADGKAAVVGGETQANGRTLFAVGAVVTLPEYRRQGLATILYKSICSRLKVEMISDSLLTPSSIALWKSLSRFVKVRGLRSSTQELFDLASIEDAINGDEDVKLYAKMESHHAGIGMVLPEQVDVNPIIEQAVHYTSKDQLGLWD